MDPFPLCVSLIVFHVLSDISYRSSQYHRWRGPQFIHGHLCMDSKSCAESSLRIHSFSIFEVFFHSLSWKSEKSPGHQPIRGVLEFLTQEPKAFHEFAGRTSLLTMAVDISATCDVERCGAISRSLLEP